MLKFNKVTFLFPGQGAQYPGMGKDFSDEFLIAKETFQEADDVLKRPLSDIIFNGPKELLTETRNSQVAIFVMSIAILRVINQLFPELSPKFTAGLSLGEYTALCAAKKISFKDCLPLVQVRGELMHEACESLKGTMAAVMGLSASEVKAIVDEINLPNDLWAANFNCPGQVVISGTEKGVERGIAFAKAKGARCIPLKVHGAFHSGLMKPAEDRLVPFIQKAPLIDSSIPLIHNRSAKSAKTLDNVKNQLIHQVTSPVYWEDTIRLLDSEGGDLYLEIGCGKVLKGFNQKMEIKAPTLSIEKIADLDLLKNTLNG